VKRLTVAFVVMVVWSLFGATAVLAAPPSNDDITSPTVVGPLPYADGPYDTTEATTGATDPGFCFDPEGPPDQATVWYSFTPAVSDTYRADTFGSDYDTTAYVGTPDGAGGIDVIACNDDVRGELQAAVRWDATAGTTYLIMVGTCCGGGVPGQAGGGGSLQFHVDVAPPAPTIDIELDPTGGFTQDGAAIISGTLACSPGVEFVQISVDVTQRVGRFTITGFGGDFFFGCPSTWTVTVESDQGLFRGGRVEVNALAFGCDAIDCAEDFASATVRLGGVDRPAVSPPVGPPICPPKGGHVTPPMGRPECPPVSPPVTSSAAAPGGGGASPVVGALRADPAVLIGSVFVGVMVLAMGAGAVAATQARRGIRLAESGQSN
jgi:hypothetical protein